MSKIDALQRLATAMRSDRNLKQTCGISHAVIVFGLTDGTNPTG